MKENLCGYGHVTVWPRCSEWTHDMLAEWTIRPHFYFWLPASGGTTMGNCTSDVVSHTWTRALVCRRLCRLHETREMEVLKTTTSTAKRGKLSGCALNCCPSTYTERHDGATIRSKERHRIERRPPSNSIGLGRNGTLEVAKPGLQNSTHPVSPCKNTFRTHTKDEHTNTECKSQENVRLKE